MSVALINPYTYYTGPAYGVDLPGSTQSASRSVTDPANANAGWQFNVDGTVDRRQGSWSYNHDWGAPTGGTPGTDYEIKCILNSGSTPSGDSVGTWLALTSARSWTLSQTTVGSKSCNLTIQIRDAATSTLQDSQTYTIAVTVGSGGTTTTGTGPTTGTDPTNPTY